eukprot:1341892-Pyramimonas_sp.AAC.1
MLAHVYRLMLSLRTASPQPQHARQHAKTTWIHHVLDDLRWLRTVTKSFQDFPDPADSFHPWEQHIRRSITSWRRQLRAAQIGAAQAAARQAWAARAERIFFQCAREGGFPLPVSHPDHPLRAADRPPAQQYI